jgi:hypothetical protein
MALRPNQLARIVAKIRVSLCQLFPSWRWGVVKVFPSPVNAFALLVNTFQLKAKTFHTLLNV